MKETDVVLYIGSHELVAVAGHVDQEPHIQRHVIRREPEGFSNGLVTNLERASNAVDEILSDLFKNYGERYEKMKPLLSLYVVLGNAKLRTFTFASSQFYNGFRKHITTHDIRAVIEQTKSVATLPLSDFVLQVVPVSFLVNDLEGIDDPLNLDAQRLGVTLKIFTMEFESFKNISKALEVADLTIRGYYPKPLTTSQAVLTDPEKEERSLLIDIDRDVTYLTDWKKGELVNTKILPFGERFLSEKIAAAWRIDLQDAQRVQEHYGQLHATFEFGDELIPLIVREGHENCPIKRQDFQKDFLGFASQWLQKLIQEAQAFAEGENLYHPRYIFTGFGTRLEGFLEFVQSEFAIDGRIGHTRKLRDVPAECLFDPALTDAFGMMVWLASAELERERLVKPSGFLQQTAAAARNLFVAYF